MKPIKQLIKSHAPYILLMLSCLALVVLLSFSLAWFGKKPLAPTGGEVMPGYFAGGEGTAELPYVINRPIHLYNLAWLQNTGRFNQQNEDGTYTQYHFVLAADLDMTGVTLPPIGTVEFPFIGTFESETSITDNVKDDVKYTIKNLTVSNVLGAGEISKRPQSVTELTGVEIVGMFGVIGVYDMVENYTTYGGIVPSVSDFYLESPVVRAQTQKTLIGLIAGYVNGKVHEVGVYGGTVVSGASNTAGLGNQNISFYGLIGDRAADVSWGGVPSPGGNGAGGALKVDANDTATSNAVGALTTSNFYAMVPNSEGRAYFVDKADDIYTASYSPTDIYFYKNAVTAGGSTSGYGTRNNYAQLSNGVDYTENWITQSVNSSFLYNNDLYNRLRTGGSTGIAITSAPPTTGNLQNVPHPDYDNPVPVPSGMIWFKPIAYGDCIISFGVTNMSQTRRKSIYKFKRNTDGTIKTDSLQETVLEFNKDMGLLKNQNLVVFHFQITEQDVLDGYEYGIGNTVGASGKELDDSVLFYFLALAGTSNTGGSITPQSKELFEVNFIHTLPDDYEYDSVLGPEYKVTTFVLSVTQVTGEHSVSFARTAMTAHASATATAGIEFRRYEHSTPPQQTPSS